VANEELRHWKKQAHYTFDKIALTGLINKIWRQYIPGVSNRVKAYQWLSHQMGIEKEACHIGMFGIEQCKAVVDICKSYLKQHLNEDIVVKDFKEDEGVDKTS
jgi:hypothetical protein